MDTALSPTDEAKDLLAGLTLGQILIAGSKRRSIRIHFQGKAYRIGRIAANKAFVIIRGNLRLLYVDPNYKNYRYAAKKVFGNIDKCDIDHVLGRKLTQHHRFWYTLVTRIDAKANRSHGSHESAPIKATDGIVLDKFCYSDDRITGKLLSRPLSALSGTATRSGYDIVQAHDRPLSAEEAGKVRWALGMDGEDIMLDCLYEIDKPRTIPA